MNESHGTQAFHDQKYQQAERDFADAIAARPKDPIMRLAYGHTLLALARFEKSSQSIQKGVELAPNWPKTPLNLPRDRFAENPEHWERLLGALETRMKDEEKNTDLKFLYAYCLHFSQQTQKAKPIFESIRSDCKVARYFL